MLVDAGATATDLPRSPTSYAGGDHTCFDQIVVSRSTDMDHEWIETEITPLCPGTTTAVLSAIV